MTGDGLTGRSICHRLRLVCWAAWRFRGRPLWFGITRWRHFRYIVAIVRSKTVRTSTTTSLTNDNAKLLWSHVETPYQSHHEHDGINLGKLTRRYQGHTDDNNNNLFLQDKILSSRVQTNKSSKSHNKRFRNNRKDKHDGTNSGRLTNSC